MCLNSNMLLDTVKNDRLSKTADVQVLNNLTIWLWCDTVTGPGRGTLRHYAQDVNLLPKRLYYSFLSGCLNYEFMSDASRLFTSQLPVWSTCIGQLLHTQAMSNYHLPLPSCAIHNRNRAALLNIKHRLCQSRYYPPLHSVPLLSFTSSAAVISSCVM